MRRVSNEAGGLFCEELNLSVAATLLEELML